MLNTISRPLFNEDSPSIRLIHESSFDSVPSDILRRIMKCICDRQPGENQAQRPKSETHAIKTTKRFLTKLHLDWTPPPFQQATERIRDPQKCKINNFGSLKHENEFLTTRTSTKTEKKGAHEILGQEKKRKGMVRKTTVTCTRLASHVLEREPSTVAGQSWDLAKVWSSRHRSFSLEASKQIPFEHWRCLLIECGSSATRISRWGRPSSVHRWIPKPYPICFRTKM